MMRKVIFTGVLLLGACAAVRAQSLASFKEGLAQRPAGGARLEVVEHGAAARAVEQGGNTPGRVRFKGYRIGIFFDNGANAREKALAAREAFAEAFPGEKVYLVYENPYFKVTAGNCVNSEEAIVLLGKIRSRFPEAYLMREDLTVADLVR